MSNFTIGTVIEFISNFLKIDNNNTPNDAFGPNNSVYGGSLAGNRFSLAVYLKKPQVILRIFAVFFAIIVFGCISSEDLYKSGQCPFNANEGACNFGIVIGVIAFLGCLIFLIIDARFDNLSNIKTRKRAVVADLLFSGLWSFMWFVCFCYLADSWRKTSDEIKSKAEKANVQASIAFSFFSILCWIAINLLSLIRYRQGVATSFESGYEDHSQNTSGQFNPGQNTNDLYRQAPFNTNTMMNSGGYQQPTY